MGLFNHLFKHKPSQEEEKMGENRESSHAPGGSEPSEAPPPDPSSFLHPKAYVPRGGGAPIVPGPRSPSRPIGKPSERNIHFQGSQSTPGEIVLTLGDVLSRIPTQLLKMGMHDAKRELRFKIGDLSSDIARGRAAVPLSRIAALCPDIFQREVAPEEDMEIRLPLQKLVEQIALMRSSGPMPLLERESRIPRSETPPMMLPARTPAPAPTQTQEPNVELKSAEPHSLPANAFELKPQAFVPTPPSPPAEVSKTLEERALKLDAGAHAFKETKVANEALPTPSTPTQPPGMDGSPSRPSEAPPAVSPAPSEQHGRDGSPSRPHEAPPAVSPAPSEQHGRDGSPSRPSEAPLAESPTPTQQITPTHAAETPSPGASTPSAQESAPQPSAADVAQSALIGLLRLKATLPKPALPEPEKAVLEDPPTAATDAISEPAPPPAESPVKSVLGDFPELEAFFSGMVFPNPESGMSGAMEESVAQPPPPAPPSPKEYIAKTATGDSLNARANPAESVPQEPVGEIPAAPHVPLVEEAPEQKPETQIPEATAAHSWPDVAPDPSQPSLPSVQNESRSKGFLPDLATDEPKTESPAPKRKNPFEDYLKQVPRPQPSKESIAKAALIGLYQLRAIISDTSLLESELDPLESSAARPSAASDQFSIAQPPVVPAESKPGADIVVPSQPAPETEASGSPESLSEIILGYSGEGEPEFMESETTHSVERICLSLASILKTCPPEIVVGELPEIDDDLGVELPLTQIEAQLASGSVEISSLRFIAALPPEYMRYFVVREDVKVPLPLEEIFMRLPHPIGQNVSVADTRPTAFAESGEVGEASHEAEVFPTPSSQDSVSAVENGTAEPPPPNATLEFEEEVSEPLSATPESHNSPSEEKAQSAVALPPNPVNPEPPGTPFQDPLPEIEETSQISQTGPTGLTSPTAHPEAPPVESQPPATAAPFPIKATPVAAGEDQSPVAPEEELHWPPAKEPADPPASPYESKTTADGGPFVLNIPAFRIFVPPSPPVFSSEATAINSPTPFNDTAFEPKEPEAPDGVPAKAQSEESTLPKSAGNPSELVDAFAETPSPERKASSPAPSCDLPIVEAAKEIAAELPVPVPASEAAAPEAPQRESEPSHPSLERMTLIRPPPLIRPVMIAPPRIFGGAPSSEPRENLSPAESPSAEKSPSQPDTKKPARIPTPIAEVSSAPEIAEAAKPISENHPDAAPPAPKPPATPRVRAALSPRSLKLKPIVVASQKEQTPAVSPPSIPASTAHGNGEAPAPIAASAPAPPITIATPKAPVLHVPPLPKPEPANPPGENPPAHLPPPLPLLRFDQSVLQTLFMTDDLLDLPAICRHVAALPGLQACMIARREETSQAGEFPEGFEISSLLAFAPGVKEVAGRLPIGALKNFTLYAEEHSVSFFERPGVCLCVVHRARSFIPGVREKLITVSDELSKA